MDVVLDLDLDFFVWPIFHNRKGKRRIHPSRVSHLATEGEVRRFLENSCHLNTGNPIYGRLLEEHDEAFDVWKEWLKEGIISCPFKIIHVDAHADQGMGDRSWRYLLTEFLAIPIHERATPPRGNHRMNAGNYVMFAIANRWLASFVYVHPVDPTAPPDPP